MEALRCAHEPGLAARGTTYVLSVHLCQEFSSCIRYPLIIQETAWVTWKSCRFLGCEIRRLLDGQMTVCWPNLFRQKPQVTGLRKYAGKCWGLFWRVTFQQGQRHLFFASIRIFNCCSQKMKSVPAGILTWDLLHIQEGLWKSVAPVWQVSCRPSACSFYGTTPFRMTCCLPNCITF